MARRTDTSPIPPRSWDQAAAGPILSRRHYLFALAVLVSLAAIYIAAIVSLDNTNLATTNGLWKTPSVYSWEHSLAKPLDSGEYLYLPAYGFLSRLIPDRWVSYGVHGQIVTYRKMAILNALFGALSSAALFLLALRFIGSVPAALTTALAHATTGFILLNSVNSEDVMPAYTCFVFAAWMLLEFAATGRRRYLGASAILAALVVLLHWTLMIPALTGAGVILLWLAFRYKNRRWAPATFGLFFLGSLGLGFGLVRHIAPSGVGSFWALLYPSKAGPSGWLGFGVNKIVFAFIGMGNYFSSMENPGSYGRAFDSNPLFGSMTISLIYLTLTLGACIWTLWKDRGSKAPGLLALYGTAVFCAGEFEHLYSQPQDPQSQIQPMFVTVAGLILILHFLHRRLGARSFHLAMAGLAVAFALNGAWNANRMYALRGYDGNSVEAIRELATMFPPSTTTIVTHGFEGWQTWWYVEVFRADDDEFARRNIELVSAFTLHGGISAEAAAAWVRGRVETAFAAGDRVVAGALWTQEHRDFARSLATLVDDQKAEAFDTALRKAFRTGRTWDTPVGRFVELLPPPGRNGGAG